MLQLDIFNCLFEIWYKIFNYFLIYIIFLLDNFYKNLDMSSSDEFAEEFEKLKIHLPEINIKDFEKDQIILKEEQIDSKTCYIYDERMAAHQNSPETPQRIVCIWERIKKYDLHKKSTRISSQKVSKEDLYAAHTKEMIDQIYSITNPNTLQSAILAAGSCVKLIESLIKGNFENGLVIVRPPGHHSSKNEYGGFCYFNNVAVAAQYAINKLGLKKVAIVDFDIHHGNGTQDIFYENDQVLFISTHKFGMFYPGSGDLYETGLKKGKGFTVNVPLNGSEFGDKEYDMIFEKIVIPILKDYDPELIIVSAGFDAARNDYLGDFDITPNGFGNMVYLMKNLGKKMALVLEGGYTIEMISESASECFKILLGEKPKEINQEIIVESIDNIINDVINIQSNYWKSLKQ